MLILEIDNLLYAVLLMVAEQIHLRISTRRENFFLRVTLAVSVISMIAFALPTAQDAVWATPYNLFVRAFLFGLTVLGVTLCYKLDLFYAVCRCLFGYLTYSVAHVFTLFFTTPYHLKGAADAGVPVFTDMYAEFHLTTAEYSVRKALVYIVVYAVFAIFSGKRVSEGMRPMKWKHQIAGVLTLVMAAFSYISVEVDWADASGYLLPAYFFVVYLCFLLLLLFADEKHIYDDYEMIKQLMEKEAQQYEVSKDLIDRINQKSHDLKYQIRHLKEAGENGALQELEDAIDAYDTGYKTGNDAVDVIMTEKGQLCQKHNIQLACIIDGSQLNAMEPRDVYSLLGNILDNAIEALQQMSEEDKRVINLSVTQEYGMVRIRAENYYAGQRSFQNDLPLTTKKDRFSHGYGTKSIRTIAEKYGGVAEFEAQDGIFAVNVLLPICQNAAAKG